MKRLFEAVFRANVYSFVIAAKICILILWHIVFPHTPDYFGQYALCLGLTSTFFIFSGMRGRIYVFAGIDAFKDYVYLTCYVILLGLISLFTISIIYSKNVFLPAILLVSISKFVETYLDINTSYIQKTRGRDSAFFILNMHSGMLITAFFLGLILYGLKGAIFAEIIVIIGTVSWQVHMISKFPEPAHKIFRGAFQVLTNGAELTLAATLNSAMVSGFLFWGSIYISEIDLLLIAKILALQAFCARLITGNNIFFMQEFIKSRALVSRISNRITIIGLTSLLGIFVYILMPSDLIGNSIVICFIGVIFTVMNIANIAVRQQLLLTGVVRPLIVLHSVEIILLLGICFVSLPESVFAFLIFTALRGFRNIFLVHFLIQKVTT